MENSFVITNSSKELMESVEVYSPRSYIGRQPSVKIPQGTVQMGTSLWMKRETRYDRAKLNDTTEIVQGSDSEKIKEVEDDGLDEKELNKSKLKSSTIIVPDAKFEPRQIDANPTKMLVNEKKQYWDEVIEKQMTEECHDELCPEQDEKANDKEDISRNEVWKNDFQNVGKLPCNLQRKCSVMIKSGTVKNLVEIYREQNKFVFNNRIKDSKRVSKRVNEKYMPKNPVKRQISVAIDRGRVKATTILFEKRNSKHDKLSALPIVMKNDSEKSKRKTTQQFQETDQEIFNPIIAEHCSKNGNVNLSECSPFDGITRGTVVKNISEIELAYVTPEKSPNGTLFSSKKRKNDRRKEYISYHKIVSTNTNTANVKISTEKGYQKSAERKPQQLMQETDTKPLKSKMSQEISNASNQSNSVSSSLPAVSKTTSSMGKKVSRSPPISKRTTKFSKESPGSHVQLCSSESNQKNTSVAEISPKSCSVSHNSPLKSQSFGSDEKGSFKVTRNKYVIHSTVDGEVFVQTENLDGNVNESSHRDMDRIQGSTFLRASHTSNHQFSPAEHRSGESRGKSIQSKEYNDAYNESPLEYSLKCNNTRFPQKSSNEPNESSTIADTRPNANKDFLSSEQIQGGSEENNSQSFSENLHKNSKFNKNADGKNETVNDTGYEDRISDHCLRNKVANPNGSKALTGEDVLKSIKAMKNIYGDKSTNKNICRDASAEEDISRNTRRSGSDKEAKKFLKEELGYNDSFDAMERQNSGSIKKGMPRLVLTEPSQDKEDKTMSSFEMRRTRGDSKEELGKANEVLANHFTQMYSINPEKYETVSAKTKQGLPRYRFLSDSEMTVGEGTRSDSKTLSSGSFTEGDDCKTQKPRYRSPYVSKTEVRFKGNCNERNSKISNDNVMMDDTISQNQPESIEGGESVSSISNFVFCPKLDSHVVEEREAEKKKICESPNISKKLESCHMRGDNQTKEIDDANTSTFVASQTSDSFRMRSKTPENVTKYDSMDPISSETLVYPHKSSGSESINRIESQATVGSKLAPTDQNYDATVTDLVRISPELATIVQKPVSRDLDPSIGTPCSPSLVSPHRMASCLSTPALKSERGYLESEALKVRAHGRGLREGRVGVANYFVLDTSNAEHGELGVHVIGPHSDSVTNTAIYALDETADTLQVEYQAVTPGTYTIHLTWDEEHVLGSPFTAILE